MLIGRPGSDLFTYTVYNSQYFAWVSAVDAEDAMSLAIEYSPLMKDCVCELNMAHPEPFTAKLINVKCQI